MKEISLTQDKVALVDDEDYEYLCNRKWQAHLEEKVWYAVHAYTNGHVRMHREIMKAPKGIQVDHKDGNGLNNCKENLRLATNAQNNQNKGIHVDNKSGYKGVCWSKECNKWQAAIGVNTKIINLGYFKTKEDAALAYNEAAMKYHGEFAYINNIGGK